MEKHNLHALIATHPVNVFYASEFPKHPLCATAPTPCLCDVPVYVILSLEKDIEPAIIVPMIQIDYLFSSSTWIKDVRYYGSFFINEAEGLNLESLPPIGKRLAEVYRSVERGKELFVVLKETLDEKGLSSSRLGLDEGGLNPTTFQKVVKELPDAEIVDGTGIFYETRLVKTPEEIERMKKGAEINVRAIEVVNDALKEGVTEQEMWELYDSEVRKDGAFNVYPIVAAGPCYSAVVLSPGFKPSGRPLERGDIIRIDCDLIYDYYFSDVARSGVIGEASGTKKRYHEALHAGFERAQEAIKPGVKPSKIFRIAVDTIRNSGIPAYDRPVCGHGIGIECYNPLLSISPKSNIPLEEGMTLNLETPYYELGLGGYNLENTILVTRNGHEILSDFSTELRIY